MSSAPATRAPAVAAPSGTSARAGLARDRRIVAQTRKWFAAAGRPLPWRTEPRDPYRSLVSELMLQQTQVSRVVERFQEFVRRFPTVEHLSRADESRVLALWSGLGYYRRARHLHAAAGEIVSRFGSRVPETVSELMTLPGVGRHTAGAISSIVFGRPEPIVDGNVARVLIRVEGRDVASDEGAAWAWERASGLVRLAQSDPGRFNEGLMELGATVCLPKSPRCGECPLRRECRALAAGAQDRIPRPRAVAARSRVFCAAVVVQDDRGRLLVERRDSSGMWAGLWQAPTLEGRARARRATVERWIGAPAQRIERFDHGATHRDLEFEVWSAAGPVSRAGAVYKSPREIAGLGLSSPMRRILLGRGLPG